MAYTSVAALFTAICNSIRAKLGTTDPIDHQDIPASIDAIVTDEGGADVSGVTATAADVRDTVKFVDSAGVLKDGTMPNRGAVSGTISTKSGTYTVQSGYHSGSGSVAIASAEQEKIIAGNIKSGVTILGEEGTYTGSSWQNASGTVNPNSSGDVTISGLSFSPKICAIYWYDYDMEETNFYLFEYVGGDWLMSGGVFGWRLDENLFNVSTTSSSITIDELTIDAQTVNYSVWG